MLMLTGAELKALLQPFTLDIAMSAARSPDELRNKIREPATSTGLVYDEQCC